jgi:hypothetical protein
MNLIEGDRRKKKKKEEKKGGSDNYAHLIFDIATR